MTWPKIKKSFLRSVFDSTNEKKRTFPFKDIESKFTQLQLFIWGGKDFLSEWKENSYSLVCASWITPCAVLLSILIVNMQKRDKERKHFKDEASLHMDPHTSDGYMHILKRLDQLVLAVEANEESIKKLKVHAVAMGTLYYHSA